MNEWFDCYKVGDNEYQGYFRALDASIDVEGNQTGWVEYQADPELIKNLEDMKRPNEVSTAMQIKLMLKGLKRARNNFKKLRLLFSGGTDSWTILKICIDNKIYIDELLCHLHSFEESPTSMQNRTNIEFLPGLKYARQHEGTLIGKILTPKHSIDKLENFVNDSDIHKHAPGPFLPLRSAMYYRHINSLDTTDTCTISGLEKPEFVVEDNNLFWTLMDSPTGEWMGIKNHVPLYLDKHNPELTVHMAYRMIDFLPADQLQGKYRHINWTRCDTRTQRSLVEAWGVKTPYNWLNLHTMKSRSHSQAPKTTYFLREAKALGVTHLISQYMQQMANIYDRYKQVPYAVSFENNWVASVGRFSQKVAVGRDSFGKTQVK